MNNNSIVNRFSNRMANKSPGQEVSNVFDHDYKADGFSGNEETQKSAQKLSPIERERRLRDEELASRRSRTSKMIDEMHNDNSTDSEVSSPEQWNGIKHIAAANAFDEADAHDDQIQKDISIGSLKFSGNEACENIVKD